MGRFEKMFEKKTCAIFDWEIGLLGNGKLEDENLCKCCESRLFRGLASVVTRQSRKSASS